MRCRSPPAPRNHRQFRGISRLSSNDLKPVKRINTHLQTERERIHKRDPRTHKRERSRADIDRHSLDLTRRSTDVSSPQESSAPNVLNGKSQLSTAESKIASPSRPITTRYSFDDDSTATNKLIPAIASLNSPAPAANAPPQRRKSTCASCPGSQQTQNQSSKRLESHAQRCRPTRSP